MRIEGRQTHSETITVTILHYGKYRGLTAKGCRSYASSDGSPPDDSEGINREHGEDDPIGTKTVAAPATVSGLLSILAA